MKKTFLRSVSLLLLLAMLLPMATVATAADVKKEFSIFYEDFSQFSEREEGSFLTQEDGFSNQIPSTTAVKKDGDNTYLQVDFASANDPNKTVYFLNQHPYELVEEGTEGAVSTDEASYGLISGVDPNLDKNLQLIHPSVSYAEYETVILEAKYFIEQGSKGSLYAQLHTYTAGTANKAFLYLYDIVPSTGELRVSGTRADNSVKLQLGAWNTVSAVVNLRTGAIDCYLNNVLYSTDGTLGQTNIGINANSFIVGKIQRTRVISHKASEELAGFFCVDDARIYVPGDKTLTMVPVEDELGGTLSFVRLMRNGKEIGEYTQNFSFLISDGVTLQPIYYYKNVEEISLHYNDFSQFASKAGTLLTREDGFANDIPSTTAVVKEGDNTYLKVDFVSGNDPSETVYYKKANNFATVEPGTEGAFCTDAASYGLISGHDPNIDKNLQLMHPSVSYEQYETVVLEAKYFIEEGSKGSIYAQLRTCTAGTESKNFLALYHIDPATGTLHASGTVMDEDAKLRIGAWNTVSTVINLRTGEVDFYLNYAPYRKWGYLGVTDIKIDENSFIAAKIHRTGNTAHLASEQLSGSFCVDDARMYVPADPILIKIPETDAYGAPLVSVKIVKGDRVLAEHGAKTTFLATDGIEAVPHYYQFISDQYRDIVRSVGTEVRVDEHGGLRFISALSAEKYNALLAEAEREGLQSVTLGTLIAPVSYAMEAGGMSKYALDRLSNRVNYLDIPFDPSRGWYSADTASSETEDLLIAASLTDIDPSHYDDEFAAVGYVRVTAEDGTVFYTYAKWDGTGVSISEAAMQMLASGEEYPEEVTEFLNDSVLTPVSDAGGAVREISYAKNHLFFRVGESIYASLYYTGDGAWRLKAQPGGYLGFTGMGAAQALAYYMNEEQNETVLPIEITRKNAETLYIYSEDGCLIELGIGNSFFIRVFNKNGKEVSYISDISMSGDDLILKGKLADGEAVFGGGEKLDSVNRRGMLTRLYSTDGWNNSGSSYMPIPLFFTSRGGGFFFNRYEDMLADFGKETTDEWKLTLRHDVMDCYLYATEEGKEVITHYTALTGAAAIPDEWAYGVMVCRYSSDLTTFETDQEKTNNDGAPSGRSVKTLVGKLIEAGMTPSAVIMEAWNYQQVSTNEARRKELQDTIDWLDTYNIKAMVYMRVGSSVSSSMVGYREEYFVHANITQDGTTTYTMQIPDITAGSESGNPDAPKGGKHIYLDITNPEAVDWYCNVIWGQLVDMGIDGVKIDFCETMPDDGYSYGGVVINYDWYDPSIIAKGGEHHSYPVYFISTFFNKMNERKKANGEEEGFFVLSRGGGIGSQRNPFLWAGDQTRQFDKLDDQIMATVTSGLSGVPFMSFDMAGYRYGSVKYANENSYIYESEMMARAVEFTAFMINIQTHGTVRNIYELSDGAQEIYRIYTQMHEDLYPYITKLVLESCTTGVPTVRHPVLEYQDDANVYNIKDQFLLGDALMVAPILAQSTYERSVYLPEGMWTNLLTGEVYVGGRSYTVEANIGQIPIFLNNASEDAAAIREVFNSDTWKKVQNWTAPLDSQQS